MKEVINLGKVFKLPYTVFNSNIKSIYYANLILSDKKAIRSENIIISLHNGYATISGKLNMPVSTVLEISDEPLEMSNNIMMSL